MKKILSILFLVLLIGCGNGGTDTGNPSSPTSGNPIGDMQNTTEAGNILSALCTKLNGCFGALSVADCETGVLAVSNLEDAFGLTEGSIGTFQQIVDTEDAGTLTANSDASNTCQTDISNLNCSDTTVTSAYSADDASNFDNVQNMIPTGGTSCEGIY